MSRPTRKQFEEATLKRANSVAQLITAKHAYVDTVVNWFHITLKPEHIAEIDQRCDGDAWINYDKPMKYQPWWKCKLTMQKPKDTAFYFLEALAGGFIEDYPYHYIITQTHFALDHVTATVSDKESVHEFNATHLVKAWPGKQMLGNYDGTLYSAKYSKTPMSSNFVQYSDLPSKVDGQPCDHLEWKCLCAPHVKKAGVQSFDDFINFRHRDFWEPKLRYQAIDYGALGRRMLKTKRRQPREKDFRTGHFIARMAAYRHAEEPNGEFIRPYGSVAAIREVVGAKLVNKCVFRFPNDQFLP